jgi:hypothetical protein
MKHKVIVYGDLTVGLSLKIQGYNKSGMVDLRENRIPGVKEPALKLRG